MQCDRNQRIEERYEKDDLCDAVGLEIELVSICFILLSDLHDKRIQNVVFGTSPNPETLYEEKIFEEELDLQLSLLQDEVPESYLFPEVEEEMEDLPHLKDGTAAASVQETIDKENKILLFEELAEEGVIESLAICGFLGLMMFAPQAVFH